MTPPYSKLRTRAEFEAMLAEALADTRKMEAAEPLYPVWHQIRGQLEAAAARTQDGRTPTKTERDNFMVGTIAARELEPAADLERYQLIQKLHELQYYYQVFLT